MSRAFLAVLSALVLASFSAVGGCSDGESGGSGENPSTILATLSYQGAPVEDRWIDICSGLGFSPEEQLCPTSYVANAGLTDEQGQAIVKGLPPGASELCLSTEYTIPVRVCLQQIGVPLDPNLRCQSDADCQGFPTRCACRPNQPDCGVNDTTDCSTDLDCPVAGSFCSGTCGGKKDNNYFFRAVGFCSSTWEGTCSGKLCSTGLCEDTLEPCTLEAGCGQGIECLFSGCADTSDCALGDTCEASKCASSIDCAIGQTCDLPPNLQKVCSSNGVPCESQQQCPNPETDSCGAPLSVCSISGDSCSPNEPCTGGNCSVNTDVPCSTNGECANLAFACSISSTPCIDDSDCPSNEACGPQTCTQETCVNALPGDPCYSIPLNCPTYCLTNPDQLCVTAADCGLVCRYSRDPCETDDNCSQKACTLTRVACTGQGAGQCSAQNLCSETGQVCTQDEDCPFRECSQTGAPCVDATDCADEGKFCSNTGRACEETTDCTGDGECEAQTCDPTQTCNRDLCRLNRCIVNPDETCDQRSDEQCLVSTEATSLCGDPLPSDVNLAN